MFPSYHLYSEEENFSIPVLRIGKWKNLVQFFHVRSQCAHERGNRECGIVNLLCSDYLVSDPPSRMVLQNYHHKKPNTTGTDSDLTLSPRAFGVEVCTATTDYQLKAIAVTWPKARLRLPKYIVTSGYLLLLSALWVFFQIPNESLNKRSSRH
jgi:hypothetical protein